jgi:hypothetical protein
VKKRALIRLILAGVLVLLLIGGAVSPAFAASPGFTIIFNGESYPAEAYIETGTTMIKAESLQKVPGLKVEGEGFIPLRQFFEDRGGVVTWVEQERSVNISWQEMKDGYTANQLVVASGEKMKELNTYKLTGHSVTEMSVVGAGTEKVLSIPSFVIKQTGSFQQEPLAMHLTQEMQVPYGEMGLSEEEMALGGEEAILTEMVWTDNTIYQKLPSSDHWVVQDLDEMGLMGLIEKSAQMTPQQSLEMMVQYGLYYTFGEDRIIKGQEYYVVNSYISTEAYKKLLSSYLGDDFLKTMASSLPPEEQNGLEEEIAQRTEYFNTLLETMEMEYYVQSLINKNTLTNDYVYYDLVMKFSMEDPEGAGLLTFSNVSSGEYALSGFGEPLELPALTNVLTQEEYLEQLQAGSAE